MSIDETRAVFEPGQVILVGGRAYKVTGVFLGAVGQVSLIQIEPLSERPGFGKLGGVVETLYVPEKILAAAVDRRGNLYVPYRERDLSVDREEENDVDL